MTKMLLVVAAVAAGVLGGCASAPAGDPGESGGATPEMRVLPSSASPSPTAEPTVAHNPFTVPPMPPAAPVPPPRPAAPDPPPAPDPEPVAPAPRNECDPNYSGACVPVAGDVDCAGGSGNGPAYVRGPVYVVGSDVYDLDRNNDGVGCE